MPTATGGPDAATATLRRRGIRLAVLIIVWDVIEGVVAVTAGFAAGSIALVGFGIDSAIEGFAASVVSGSSEAVYTLGSGPPCERSPSRSSCSPSTSRSKRFLTSSPTPTPRSRSPGSSSTSLRWP